jgi:hypothetical protein
MSVNEKFNMFIFSIDNSLEYIREKSRFGESILDLSLDSLDKIEQYLLQSDVKLADIQLINMAAQYLGETVRKTYGGKWVLGDDDASSLTQNLPVIIGHNAAGNPFSPITIIENFAVHRDAGLLKSAVAAEFEDFDFGLQPE